MEQQTKPSPITPDLERIITLIGLIPEAAQKEDKSEAIAIHTELLEILKRYGLAVEDIANVQPCQREFEYKIHGDEEYEIIVQCIADTNIEAPLRVNKTTNKLKVDLLAGELIEATEKINYYTSLYYKEKKEMADNFLNDFIVKYKIGIAPHPQS